MASSSYSSKATTTCETKYDVFLSFRGKDTRENFTSHLHAALDRKAIKTFIDDDLHRGDEISESLLEAIEESKIAIIIFSKSYATSRWCLEELAKILVCKKSRDMMVIPVFYHVDSLDVRHQTGTFGEAFVNHEQLFEQSLEKVKKWRAALTEVANLSGFDSKNYRTEAALIEEIVKNVLKRLNHISQCDNKGLVGIESRIKEIELLLDFESKNVISVGLWGMGGIGKTTLARAIYTNHLSHFDSYHFVDNIREESEKRGITCLGQELRIALLEDQSANLDSRFTKSRLNSKKILIVFYDVMSSRQIEKLIGNLDCFGSGSRIIITTRNKQVLKTCGVNDKNIYKVMGLLDHPALELFSCHAFKQKHPTRDYMEISKEVVRYAKGVPLALKVLGGLLFGKTKEEWDSAMHKLERNLNLEILDVLKISYDGLNEQQKTIFLDVACFFKGSNKKFLIEFFDANGLDSEIEFSILVDKSLITITPLGEITMHDLLQEMGKKIIDQESKDRGKRGRLWHYEDIRHVLKRNSGSGEIEGIGLDTSKIKDIVNLKPDAFLRMHNLRYFDFSCCNWHLCSPFNIYSLSCSPSNGYDNKVHASQGLEFGSTELSYFRWWGCPLNSLPSNFDPEHLVTLSMPRSNIQQILNVDQRFDKLKHVNLSYSKHLTRIPDLSSLSPNLEILILEGCTSLIKVPSSIGQLKQLVTVNLRDCISLCSVPTTFQSKSLEEVDLSGCSNLKTAPKITYSMKDVRLDGTSMTEFPLIEYPSSLVSFSFANSSWLESLPSSICELKALYDLCLSGCSRLSRLPDNLGLSCPRLTYLNLSNCQITMLPESLGELSCLRCLYLMGNKFDYIPASIGKLPKLGHLNVRNCERLLFLPDFHLKSDKDSSLMATNCISLEVISDSVWSFNQIDFGGCLKLDQDMLAEKPLLNIDSKINIVRRDDVLSPAVLFPGNEIPKWFSFQNMGSSLTLEVPPDYPCKDEVLLAVCVVATFENHDGVSFPLSTFENDIVGSPFPFRTRFVDRGIYGGKHEIHKDYYVYCPSQGFYFTSDLVFLSFDRVRSMSDGPCINERDFVVSDLRGCCLTFNFNCREQAQIFKIRKCGVELLQWQPKD